jgi:hypothetical protein
MIDACHENPPEMSRLVAFRPIASSHGQALLVTGSGGWIAPRFPESKASQTRWQAEKLLCGA